jgi:hypothetical protein
VLLTLGTENKTASLPSSGSPGSIAKKDDKKDAANGMEPSFVFLLSGLVATSLTSIVFL